MVIIALIVVEITLIALRLILSSFVTTSNNKTNKSRAHYCTRVIKRDASLERLKILEHLSNALYKTIHLTLMSLFRHIFNNFYFKEYIFSFKKVCFFLIKMLKK